MTSSLLTTPEVAEILALRVDHIYKLARENRIPHLRFGRSLRFRAEAIDAWLEEEERGKTPGQGDRVGNPR